MLVIGLAVNGPLLMLYSTLNPGTVATTGNAKLLIQVLAGMVITGAAGKITELLATLSAHAAGAVVPAIIVPHVAAVTYLVLMV